MSTIHGRDVTVGTMIRDAGGHLVTVVDIRTDTDGTRYATTQRGSHAPSRHPFRLADGQPYRYAGGPVRMGTGSLVYLDTFSGLVPAVVLAPMGSETLVRVTAARPTYRRGETFTIRTTAVVPRCAVRVRDGQHRILAVEVER